MHQHCAIEKIALRLIDRLGIRPEHLFRIGGPSPGVESLSSYVTHVAQELNMCQRSDLVGMLVVVGILKDHLNDVSDHALRIIASGLVLDKMVKLLCQIDEARGGSVVREDYVVRVGEVSPRESTTSILVDPDGRFLGRAAKVIFNPVASGGVEIESWKIETPVAQYVIHFSLSLEQRLPQVKRMPRPTKEVEGRDYVVGDEGDVVDYFDEYSYPPSRSELREFLAIIDDD